MQLWGYNGGIQWEAAFNRERRGYFLDLEFHNAATQMASARRMTFLPVCYFAHIDAAIICHCGGGSRSALVADSLQKMGYTNVKSLAGGFKAWKAADLPIEQGADAPGS